ncbi:MAG: proline--tRNA ligase [Chloroflexi bacterium]|nr:proline--tRNA ligase [Chloroflexota bacterium]MCC6896737.1 proline--tRNA ligase [Anaerolineae bacterium]
MAQQAVTPQSVDFSKWYNEIVYKADLCELSPVRGCLIIKPYGYELWEAVKSGLDRRFKATGHQNAYFPLFIPESFLKREAQHVEGFSPELAVVTIAGGKELEEPLVVRPTSETIIMDSFKNWIQSYRDLPLLINQWANVVRWEMRTRPFLRTTEFLWQEGHTAHATADEAEAETMQMLDVYADFAITDAAIPVIKGRKTEREKFAGAAHTYTIEAMMGDKKALQSGTSHNLGQNFAKAFEIKFLDQNNESQHPWTTSWGLSTRMIGAIVMAHGDDKGLRLPPKVAPIQVVLVPIFKNDDEKAPVMEAVARLSKELLDANIRIHVDKREGMSPGFKYNDWEMRGVPVRMEIGPKDVQNNTVALARRDVPGKEGKQFVPQAGLANVVQELLKTIQANMLQQATEFRDANIKDVSRYDELKTLMDEGGWARVWWAGSGDDEGRIKDETGATVRCIPFEQPGGSGTCFYTGKPADTIALFAKAY